MRGSSSSRPLPVSSGERDPLMLSEGLEEIGWRDVLFAEPRLAITVVMSELGRHCYWGEVFDDVMQAALLGVRPPVPRGAVVLPWPGSSFPARLEDDRLAVRGLILGTNRPGGWLIPLAGEKGAIIVSVATHALSTRQRQGLDEMLPFEIVEGVSTDYDVVTSEEFVGCAWLQAEAVGRLALSHYMVGSLRTMLEFARDHACRRLQFGRPVASFQAVRHKLAECLVAIESADHAARAAWDAAEFPFAAATAKLVVSRSIATVVPRTQQVLAGIGFTAEHPYHRYMKRVVTLDRVLGESDELATLVGRKLMADARAPRLVEL